MAPPSVRTHAIEAGRTITSFSIGAAGNNRVLVVAYAQSRNPNNLGTAEFDGVSMGAAVLTAASTIGTRRVQYFVMLDDDLPALAGSYDVEITGGNPASASERVSAWYCEGAKQAIPTVTATSDDGGNSAISLNLNAAPVDSWCLASIIGISNVNYTPAAGITERADQNITTAATSRAWDGDSVTTRTITVTPSNTGDRAIVAMAIEPAAGGGAVITTITGDGLYTVRAGESFTIAGSGFEASQGGGTVDIDGVECDIVSWAGDEIEATAPEEGLMFGGSKTLTVTPDTNDPDSVSNITYLPPTGMDYVTRDTSTAGQNTIWWDSNTNSLVAGLTTGCQAYFPTTATRVGGSETCTPQVENGSGVITLLDVSVEGDYEIEGVILRDVATGEDSGEYTVIVYLARELTFGLSDPVEVFSGSLTSEMLHYLEFSLNDPVEVFSGEIESTPAIEFSFSLSDPVDTFSGSLEREINFQFSLNDPVETFSGSITTETPAELELSFTLNDPDDQFNGSMQVLPSIQFSFSLNDVNDTFSGTVSVLSDKEFTLAVNDPQDSIYIKIDNPPKFDTFDFITPHLVRSSNPGLPGGALID